MPTSGHALAMVGRWWRRLRPGPGELRHDAVAGLTGAVARAPDGMASGVLAGVNPVYGLYASFAGPIAGGLATSTRLMVVTTTSAAALTAGSTLQDVDTADRPEALFLLTVLAGVVMAAAGLLKLGRYTRFVSHSVMTGFLTGIAVNIIAGQLPDLTGADATGSVALAQAVDVATNPSHVELGSLLTGLGALLLVALAARMRRLARLGALLALIVPTTVVLAIGASVSRVEDAGDIPGGLPLPALPDPGMLSPGLLVGALSVSMIVLVQGVGVSESMPNPDGTRPDTDRDFVAQGVGSLASGLYQGLPVGGSMSQTALNAVAGARSRWAAIMAGAWMLVILVAFSGLVGKVAMPTLAAILIYAAVWSMEPRELLTILRTGAISQVALVSTFLATLFLPVSAAVGVGVTLSLLLQLNREALDLAVVQLVRTEDQAWTERPAPRRLPNHRVTVLDIYGSLFYAGARTLQARLPKIGGAEQPVVVLRLRGRTSLGATFFLVVADYARHLHAAGGRLYLSGLDPELARRLRRSGRVEVHGPVQLTPASEVLGASTGLAYDAAKTWLVSHRSPSPGEVAGPVRDVDDEGP